MFEIKKYDGFVSSYKTNSIDEDVTYDDIVKILGFPPNVADDPDKVTASWTFTVAGKICAIWDYRGSRWSAYDPDFVLHLVFGDKLK